MALVLAAMATWSAVIAGSALSFEMIWSYSMPSMFTYSCEPVSADAWPAHSAMISIWAMLQAS